MNNQYCWVKKISEEREELYNAAKLKGLLRQLDFEVEQTFNEIYKGKVFKKDNYVMSFFLGKI